MTQAVVSRRAWVIPVLTMGLLLGLTGAAMAQSAPAATATTKPTLKQEELDQLLAPLALYPDSVLSQVLMACTYPLEIVQADRWLDQNKNLKGDALAVALEKQTWDASVKSLVNFPQVLKMLDEKIERTIKLGDAFLADQKRVMDTVQKLRGKAQDAGNLKSSSEQTVTVDNSGGTQVIVIQPTNPEVIYVPTYNPTVVYGTWWYPSYPPYYYYPPGYVARPGLWFGAGVAVGVAWGYAWGNCNWHGGDVNIDIDRNTNINRNIDRDRYRNEATPRDRNPGDRNPGGGQGKWEHNPSHRQGVAYRDQGVANRYGGSTGAQGAQAREAYRGRTDTGIQNNQRTGTGAGQPARPTPLPSQTGQNRANNYNQTSNNYSRDTTGMRTNTFDGANSSGAAARNYSQQGQASRSSAARTSGGGGAARSSGGGASRAGGGGRRR